MVGLPDSTRAFLSLLEDADLPDWSTAGDLGRLSIESFAASQGVGAGRSAGTLRLSGRSVVANAVRLDVVGEVCQSFQRLVVSVGASLEGFKAARGPIAEAVQWRVRLNLAAAPSAGSLVLHLSPVAAPEDDLREPGTPSLLGDDPAPLADRSLAEIIEMLADAVGADPAADSLTERMNALGPRAASAVSLLASTLAADGLDLDLAWAQSRQPTKRVHVSSAEARWLHDFVSARHLDEASVQLTGSLRTISDRRAIELQTDGGELIYVQPGDDTPSLLDELRLHERVVVTASERIQLTVGGGENRTFALISIERAVD